MNEAPYAVRLGDVIHLPTIGGCVDMVIVQNNGYAIDLGGADHHMLPGLVWHGLHRPHECPLYTGSGAFKVVVEDE